MNGLKFSVIFIVILLILAFSVRISGIEERALGVDEDWTIRISQSYKEAMDFSNSSYYPPLFFLLLVPSLSFFGVMGTRVVFALISTLSIGVFYLIALKFFSTKKAFIASMLFAFNPLCIFYSVHLRHYMP